MAPFIPTTRGKPATLRHFRDILPEHNNVRTVVPQLIGNEPRDFMQAAEQIHAMGYRCVNWNLGCPSPIVTGKGRGSALLPHPERIQRFLDIVFAALPLGLSIKARLGFSSADELLNLIPALNGYPIQELIVHPRTGRQMFCGGVDHERFGECLRLSRHRIVYNGDITSVETWESLRGRFGRASGWMIGRGALANPFLPSLIKRQSLPASPADTIRAFHDDLYGRYRDQLHGPAQVLGKMKELWSYLAAGFSDGSRLLKKVRKATRLKAYEETVAAFFETVTP